MTPASVVTDDEVVFAAGVRGILHRLGGPVAVGEWSVNAAKEIADYHLAASDRDVLIKHLRNMIMLIEANSMPLSKDEYRYVQDARAALIPLGGES